MNFGDIIDKAKGALSSEEKSDKVLDAAAGAVNKVTGGRYADKVEQARAAADARIGDEGAAPAEETTSDAQ